jgi:hypothetical protein
MLMSIYSVPYERDVRTLTPVFFLLFFALLQAEKKGLIYGCLSIQLLTLPFLHQRLGDSIRVHQAVAQREKEDPERAQAFREIGQWLDGKGEITVALRSDFARDGDFALLALPLQTPNGVPIRYALDYAEWKYSPRPLHDYYISPKPLQRPPGMIDLVKQTLYFYLYRVNADAFPASWPIIEYYRY